MAVSEENVLFDKRTIYENLISIKNKFSIIYMLLCAVFLFRFKLFNYVNVMLKLIY